MEFEKYHALGNDYLVLDPKEAPTAPTEKETVLICHRNFGLGSDGILYGPLKTEKADFGLKIYNPDGSEAEKSGNGLRIFCRYLWDQGLVKNDAFTIETLGGIVTCTVFENADLIQVEMGQITFRSSEIPVGGDDREVLNETFEILGDSYNYYCASIGNPHCVLPMEEVTSDLAHKIGPEIENHPQFPNRINVQLLKVIDRKTIQIEIWERGAGYTLASGSSSSAAASVAYKMGAVDGDITVKMPGGDISIQIDEEYNICMTGPATRVATMVLDKDFLSDL